MTSQRRMWVDESFDEEDGQAVLLLGGFALDHVHHVESVSVSQCPVSVQDMMEPVSRAVAGALGDKVMVCGGRSREEMYISRCQELDLTTWAGSQGERLQQGREDAASIVLSEELMVVTGGWDGERLLDSVELYSGQRRDWQPKCGRTKQPTTLTPLLSTQLYFFFFQHKHRQEILYICRLRKWELGVDIGWKSRPSHTLRVGMVRV